MEAFDRLREKEQVGRVSSSLGKCLNIGCSSYTRFLSVDKAIRRVSKWMQDKYFKVRFNNNDNNNNNGNNNNNNDDFWYESGREKVN